MTAHPARYSKQLWEVLLRYACPPTLDPMAGVGTLGQEDWHHNELEPEWARQCPGGRVTIADARYLPYRDASFASIITSPTYGNRMADHHEARDGSRRNTYRHALGHSLHPTNSGAMQWGRAYRELHEAVWLECVRVLRPGGHLVLNVKDHVRQGKLIRVSDWHHRVLCDLGLRVTNVHEISTLGNRYGANGALRVPYEMVMVYNKGLH